MRHLESSFQFRSPCINPEWQPGQAKPYHTKPSHFRSVFGPFWPFFGLKTPKNKRIWFQGLWPLKVHLCVVYFSLVPLLVKFIRFRNASDYMCLDLKNTCSCFLEGFPWLNVKYIKTKRFISIYLYTSRFNYWITLQFALFMIELFWKYAL